MKIEMLFTFFVPAVLAFLLIQGPSLASSGSCADLHTNSIQLQNKSLQTTRDLYFGIKALDFYFTVSRLADYLHDVIVPGWHVAPVFNIIILCIYLMQRNLLPHPIRRELTALMGSVTTLVEHERRLRSMITLQASEDDASLVALRLVLGKLAKDACNLVSR